MKIAVIGDIHGDFVLLEKLYKKLQDEGVDEVFSVGDLLDRGPQSKEVIDFCIEKNIKAVIGNHETPLLLLLKEKIFEPFWLHQMMGGIQTLSSFGIDRFKSNQEIAISLLKNLGSKRTKWFLELPFYRKIEIDNFNYWILHAGLTNNLAEKFIDSTDELMMKKIIKDSKAVDALVWTMPDFGKKTGQDNLFKFKDGIQIVGHSVVKQPILTKHFIAIDTGCGTCDPRTLTAVILPERKIIQVKD